MDKHGVDTVKAAFLRHSGGLTTLHSSQLQHVCVELGICYSADKNQMLLAKLDRNGVGVVEFEEFYHWLIKRDRKKQRLRVERKYRGAHYDEFMSSQGETPKK